MKKTIFISVAAFCEPFLEFTIKDALAKAKYPDNLSFGVVDQHIENRRKEAESWFENPQQLKYVHIHPVESRGVCWARSLVNSLLQEEDYYLQIDSHTFFEKDWDETLIKSWQLLKTEFDKPVLSVYPFGFEFNDRMEPEVKVNINSNYTLVLRVHPDTELSENSSVLRFRGEHVPGKNFVKGFHLAGGFIFASREFVEEVPYDPYFYFHGEEQGLAIRAFTRGWDIFHPPYIPLYHLYKAPNQSHQNHHWHQDWNKERHYKWDDLRESATKRLGKLLNGQLKGSFGLGHARNLQAFNELSGIDYQNIKVNRNHEFIAPVKLAAVSNEEELLSYLSRKKSI